MKLRELADLLGAVLSGDGDIEIAGVSGLHEAVAGEITYIGDGTRIKDLEGCGASAAIVPLGIGTPGLPALAVKNPRLAFAQALSHFYLKPYAPQGISDKAVIGRDSTIGAEPSIHPYAVVADAVKLGDRVTLLPGVSVGEGTVIGDDCVVHPNVCIRERVTIGKRVIIHAGAVIGSDGFGFVTDGGRHHKIPQVGTVVIEDDVEIGANCTIDRGTLGTTLIKRGTKLDNLVHIAHNVTVGEHCLFAQGVGIAGSTTIGNYVVFAGHVGVRDHVTVGDRVIASAQTVIIKDTAPGQMLGGTFAMPQKNWLKVQAILPKLPELKRLVTELEGRLKDRQKKP